MQLCLYSYFINWDHVTIQMMGLHHYQLKTLLLSIHLNLVVLVYVTKLLEVLFLYLKNTQPQLNYYQLLFLDHDTITLGELFYYLLISQLQLFHIYFLILDHDNIFYLESFSHLRFITLLMFYLVYHLLLFLDFYISCLTNFLEL